MGNGTSFLQIDHVSKKARSGESEIQILKNVNLSVPKGVKLAILGASGSGKTTLLTLMAGLDVPDRGEIYFQGLPLTTLDEEERAVLRSKQVGFIFQSFQLLPTLTAVENVMLPLEIQYHPVKEAQEKAVHWLSQVGLSDRLHHYPTQLSGGEQQRVAIARAFINQPAIIFADEMTGNLDTKTGSKVVESLFTLNEQQKTTIVLVTHDEKLAALCQQRFVLQEGELSAC